jgi:branched-chain amino acid transport system substrate-binding protein
MVASSSCWSKTTPTTRKRQCSSAQKLVNQDKVFAVVGHTGTAHNNASMPIQFEKNVINFFPVTAAREMYEPFHRLKFSFAATYYDQMRGGLPELFKRKKYAEGLRHLPGRRIRPGSAARRRMGLKSMGKEFAEKTSYKRGATDFSSQVARMKAANCDLVVMGTIIRETIGTIGESRKTGFSPDFLARARPIPT